VINESASKLDEFLQQNGQKAMVKIRGFYQDDRGGTYCLTKPFIFNLNRFA